MLRTVIRYLDKVIFCCPHSDKTLVCFNRILPRESSIDIFYLFMQKYRLYTRQVKSPTGKLVWGWRGIEKKKEDTSLCDLCGCITSHPARCSVHLCRIHKVVYLKNCMQVYTQKCVSYITSFSTLQGILYI